jgi:hypothetical protein
MNQLSAVSSQLPALYTLGLRNQRLPRRLNNLASPHRKLSRDWQASEDYDTVFYVRGLGLVWDLADNPVSAGAAMIARSPLLIGFEHLKGKV